MNLQSLADPAAAARQSKLVIDFAGAALRGGNLPEAQRLLREHLVRSPLDANALGMLAEIAADQRRIEEAAILFRRAADADPTAWRFLALIRHLQATAGMEAALKAIDAIPQPFRGEYEVRAAEAAAFGILGQHDRQLAIYEDLTQVAPEDESLWKTLGDGLKTVGRLDEAVAALRQAIRCRPGYGEAYWTLANFKAFRFSDSDISAMRKAGLLT